MQQPQDIPVAPVPTHANGWLWLPLVLAIGAAAAAMTLESDTPPPLAAWLTLPFVLLVGGVLAMAMRRRAIVLDNRELQVRATFYTKRFAIETIDLDKARVVSLDRNKFEALLDTNPRLVYDVMRAIVRRVHRTLRRMNLQYVELTNYISQTHGRY